MISKVENASKKEGALNGYRLIDIGAGLAASVAGLMLAESGCEVVKVRLNNRPSQLSPLQREMWDRSKVELNLSYGGSVYKEIQELLEGADGVIHDLTPSEAESLGLDDRNLLTANPDLIISSVTGWPAGHPKQNGPVSDPLVLAEAGFFDEQAAVNREGPVYLRFPLGSWHAASLVAAGFLARLYARESSNCCGGSVRTSLLQGALIPQMMMWYRTEKSAPGLAGWPKRHPTSLFECSDGGWLHVMGQPAHSPMVKDAIAKMSGQERDRLNRPYESLENPFIQDWGAVKEILKTLPCDKWLQHFWEVGIPAQSVAKMGDLYFDEQAKVNNYVVPVETESLGWTFQPGVPFHMDAPPQPRTRKGLEHWPRKELRDADSCFPEKGPLSGVKVLDLGSFLAGPLTAMLLSDLGAEVIKLEAPTGDPMRPVAWAFNGCQRGKRGLALSLKEPEARPILEKLIHEADIVHHNIRLPSAKKLGVDYDTLKALNPKLIYSHVSSYGRFGPRKDWPGYDQLFQAATGWELEGAGESNPPMWHRFGMMDHLGALSSLVTTLIALVQRVKSGRGQFVASSLLGASMFTTETLLDTNKRLIAYPKLDSDQLGVSPVRRLYQCNDGWIVVHDLANNRTKELIESAGVSALDELEAYFATIHTAEALRIAWAAGIEAVEVNFTQRDLFLDNEKNRELKLVVTMEHPVYGYLEQPGMPWNFDDSSTFSQPLAPPLCGQHTREILRELDYSDDQIDQFVDSGVVA